MYDVHLRLIGKCVVDFLLVLIELFSLGVMGYLLGPFYIVTGERDNQFRQIVTSIEHCNGYRSPDVYIRN